MSNDHAAGAKGQNNIEQPKPRRQRMQEAMTATTTTRERQVEVRKQPAAQKHEWRQVKGREMNKKKTKNRNGTVAPWRDCGQLGGGCSSMHCLQSRLWGKWPLATCWHHFSTSAPESLGLLGLLAWEAQGHLIPVAANQDLKPPEVLSPLHHQS